jgi:hypothetical protein
MESKFTNVDYDFVRITFHTQKSTEHMRLIRNGSDSSDYLKGPEGEKFRFAWKSTDEGVTDDEVNTYGVEATYGDEFTFGMPDGRVPTPASRDSVLEKYIKRTDRADIERYFEGLPKWKAPQDLTSPEGTAGNPNSSENNQDGRTFTCVTTPYDIRSSPEEVIMFQPSLGTLWLGALVQGNGYSLGIGSVAELPLRKRAPLAIAISRFVTPPRIVVENPTATSVTEAIARLVAPISGDPGSDIYFDMKTTYSFEQAMLSLGFSAKYAGAEMSATHSSVITAEKSVVTATYLQRCFTMFIDQPATPADFFSDKMTLDDIKVQERLGNIGSGNIPVFVSSITYGRLIYATISSERSVKELRNALTMSYNAGTAGGSGKIDDQSKEILEKSEIEVTALGVEDKNVKSLIQTGSIQKFFDEPMSLKSVSPLSFIMSNLGTLTIAGLTDAAHYDITICGPKRIDHASAPTEKMANTIDETMRTYYNFVVAALGNRHDEPTRNLRRQQAAQYSGAIVERLKIIRAAAATYTSDDRSWLLDWIVRLTAEIKRQSDAWASGYSSNTNDGISRDTYSLAAGCSAEQTYRANAASEELKKQGG